MRIKTMVLEYDPTSYGFDEVMRKALGAEQLDSLHDIAQYPLFARENDQQSMFHERLYGMGEEFFRPYRRFLTEVVRPFIGEDIIYQRIPTFRVHLPGNVAVGAFHRDRDYAHGDSEINFWLPVTRAWDTNTVWIESREGAADYEPQPCEIGEVLIFDGVNLAHGNKVNTTDKTRVSFDFRVVPRSEYVPSTRTSINTKMTFAIGDYFEVL